MARKIESARTVVVTGASSGIGAACCEQLTAAGFQVVGTSRAGAAISVPNSGTAHFWSLDLESADSVAAFASRVNREYKGTLFGLVNNAGIVVAGPVEMLDRCDLERQLAINLTGPVQLTRLLLPELRATSGRIVNIGSDNAIIAPPYWGHTVHLNTRWMR